jgi:hypothetical protein
MRIRLPTGFAISALLVSSAALAAEPEAPEAEDQITVEEALAEPADPDDEADIRADDDPNDVGQEALEPPESEAPSPGEPPPRERDLPPVDRDDREVTDRAIEDVEQSARDLLEQDASPPPPESSPRE